MQGQISIDEWLNSRKEPCSIHKKLYLIELFAGYGSQHMALKRLGADVISHRCVEFDKYAIKSYNAVHGTNYPVIDIRDVKGSDLGIEDTINRTYLVTYSFPCTDLSVAGKQMGMAEGSGTRSSLLWEVKRILWELKSENRELPQILFMENVPDVVGKKNKADFDKWVEFLDSLGYKSYYKILNAMDYGIPQHRKRCFMFSFLNDVNYEFPNPIPLTINGEDLLEEEVDEKYYMTSPKAMSLIEQIRPKIEAEYARQE